MNKKSVYIQVFQKVQKTTSDLLKSLKALFQSPYIEVVVPCTSQGDVPEYLLPEIEKRIREGYLLRFLPCLSQKQYEELQKRHWVSCKKHVVTPERPFVINTMN